MLGDLFVEGDSFEEVASLSMSTQMNPSHVELAAKVSSLHLLLTLSSHCSQKPPEKRDLLGLVGLQNQ